MGRARGLPLPLLLLLAARVGCVRLRTEPESAAAGAGAGAALPAHADGPNLSTIHVAYSSDASGFMGTLASMLSLAKRLKEPEHCVIHFVVSAVDMELANELVQCFKRELAPKMKVLPEVQLHLAPHVRFNYLNYIRRLWLCKDQAFARIYLPQILPNVDRVLYLDFDTIVKDDVGPLYRMQMNHSMAAVVQPEESARHMYEKHRYERLMHFFENPDAHTFNSGVLLMDLRRWRAENVTQALEALVDKTQMVEDQFLMNVAFQPNAGLKFDHLDTAWNLYNMGNQKDWSHSQLKSAKILHWSSFFKPWSTKYGKSVKNYKKEWEAPAKCPAAEKWLHVAW